MPIHDALHAVSSPNPHFSEKPRSADYKPETAVTVTVTQQAVGTWVISKPKKAFNLNRLGRGKYQPCYRRLTNASAKKELGKTPENWYFGWWETFVTVSQFMLFSGNRRFLRNFHIDGHLGCYTLNFCISFCIMLLFKTSSEQ